MNDDPVKPAGVPDDEWAEFLETHHRLKERQAKQPKREEPAAVGETLEAAMERISKLPPIPRQAPLDTSPSMAERVNKACIPQRQFKAWCDCGGNFTLEPRWLAACNILISKMGSGCLVGILGDRGRGKTQMAVCAAMTLLKSNKSVKFCTAMDFFTEIKRTYKPNAKEAEDAVIARYISPSLLIVDEIHERSDSEWENRLLFHTVNKRYEAIKDTILMGYYPTEAEFRKSVGASIVSRLRETGGMIYADWKSFRGD